MRFRAEGLGFGGFPRLTYPCRGRCIEDCSTLGSILGSPYSGKNQHIVRFLTLYTVAVPSISFSI